MNFLINDYLIFPACSDYVPNLFVQVIVHEWLTLFFFCQSNDGMLTLIAAMFLLLYRIGSAKQFKSREHSPSSLK